MTGKEQLAFLETLTVQYSDMLMDYAWRFCSYRPERLPDAQDAVQDTFVKAVRYVDRLMVHPNPAAWLKAALKHSLISGYRARRRRPEVLSGDVNCLQPVSRAATLAALERWFQRTRLQEVVEAARTMLTPNEQETFRDHFLMGLTSEECAVLEEISPEAVRGRIVRIRSKIRKNLLSGIWFVLLSALYQVRG